MVCPVLCNYRHSCSRSMLRTLTYFASDAHLGLNVADPQGREKRFVDFLRSIPADRTESVYLLGDIFDFWYEWKRVVPKGYVRVFAALMELIDAGVNVYFIPGNHDVWAYGYFEQLGMKILSQPSFVEIGGKTFCIAHGDAQGPMKKGYKVMYSIFHNHFLQKCFNIIHPDLSMAFGLGWSKGNRLSRGEKYVWRGEQEPLLQFARKTLASRHVDYFVFGHLHIDHKETLPGGAQLIILDSWIETDNCFVFDSSL